MGLRALRAARALFAPVLALVLLASLYLPKVLWDPDWPAVVLRRPGGSQETQFHYPPSGPLPNNYGGIVDAHMPPELLSINATAQYFVDNPIHHPYKNEFGQVGERAIKLKEWITLAEKLKGRRRKFLNQAIDQAAIALFPYLTGLLAQPEAQPGQVKGQVKNVFSLGRAKTPLADLRARFEPGTRGIVIPTGRYTARFATHLVVALTSVLLTDLPIQIAYSGESDLPIEYRRLIQAAVGTKEISFLDVTTVFDDSVLRLAGAGWAVKAFAALATSFEEVILLDADAVFVQPPEVLLRQESYVDRGALFFHDRLLWPGIYPHRHAWWHSQILHPSAELNKSRVWNEGYAEEGDSGVVVINKGRLDTLVGLLHVGWQNSYPVRDEVTYKITYGDKETWWLGMELTGAPYAFEAHYGGIAGWDDPGADGNTSRICSFVIAHPDERGFLLWYNGSLLKNKFKNATAYAVPDRWAVGGEWEKTPGKQDVSCVVGGDARELTPSERGVLERSVEIAKRVDVAGGYVPAGTYGADALPAM